MTFKPKYNFAGLDAADIAETLCRERCAQMGDPPCSKFGDEPHCDECTGMALAVLEMLKEHQA